MVSYFNQRTLFKKTRSVAFCFFMAVFFISLEVFFRKIYSMEAVGRIIESLLYVFLLLLVVRFSKYKASTYISVYIITSSFLFQLCHYAVYHSWLSAIEIYLFFEKINEVFVSAVELTEILILPCLISAVVLFSSLYTSQLRRNLSERQSYFYDILLVIFILIPILQVLFSNSMQDASPSLRYSVIKAQYKVNGYFFARTLPNQLFGMGMNTSWSRDEPVSMNGWEKDDNSIKNIVIIMGESQNSDNMGVFGYKKNTTPFLSKMTDVAVIKKTYAAGTFTDVSLPTFFNMIDSPDGTQHIFSWKSNLFRLAKNHDYKTHFFSAQARDTMALMSRLGLQYIDDFKDPLWLGYDANSSAQDNELLPLLDDVNISGGRNFVIIHQIGSHGPYSTRTLTNEKHFGSASLEDEYNNSVLKTDNLIRSVYEKLITFTSDNWLLIYTSDHGQYVKDGAFGHGSLSNSSHYIVPTAIFSNHNSKFRMINEKLSPCNRIFHHQVSSLIVNAMGYIEPIKKCDTGIVNGSRLDGSAGFKVIRQ